MRRPSRCFSLPVSWLQRGPEGASIFGQSRSGRYKDHGTPQATMRDGLSVRSPVGMRGVRCAGTRLIVGMDEATSSAAASRGVWLAGELRTKFPTGGPWWRDDQPVRFPVVHNIDSV